MIRFGLALACCIGMVAGCGAPSDSSGGEARTGPLRVTATTGMIADVARVVGGEHVTVEGLMGPGVDPHLYKATQGDLKKLREADMILFNGLFLEGRMADTFVQMASRGVNTVQVTADVPEDLLREPPEFAGHYDPHLWMDVSLWKYVVESIRDAYSEADPANAEVYAASAKNYLEVLDELHAYAAEQFASVPKERRVLVTAHDAFGYMGRAYDVEVMGLQGISTAAEFGTQDVENLVKILVSRNIPAVFVESSIPRRTVEALVEAARARGHNVKIGGELFSDAMGADGTPEGSYVGMIRHNVDTIVGALR